MIRVLVEHARRHAVAYVALTCAILAMGGAAYASFQLPNGAVGEKQIKNSVIDPVKWDPAYTTGFVRRWATVDAKGKVLSTSPGGQATVTKSGVVAVTWGDAFAAWCAPVATVLGTPPKTTTTTTTSSGSSTTSSSSSSSTASTPAGFADASIQTRNLKSTLVNVMTFGTDGHVTPEPFSVAVICGPGGGSGQAFPTS
jgi:hypothetical protein